MGRFRTSTHETIVLLHKNYKTVTLDNHPKFASFIFPYLVSLLCQNCIHIELNHRVSYCIAGKFGEFTGYERLARKSLVNG